MCGRGECRARWVGVTSRPECARAAPRPATGPRGAYAALHHHSRPFIQVPNTATLMIQHDSLVTNPLRRLNLTLLVLHFMDRRVTTRRHLPITFKALVFRKITKVAYVISMKWTIFHNPQSTGLTSCDKSMTLSSMSTRLPVAPVRARRLTF